MALRATCRRFLTRQCPNRQFRNRRKRDAIISHWLSAEGNAATHQVLSALKTLDNRDSQLATEQELSDFLKSVEKRAFKRSIYHVRDEEAALDIVQDSMMKLAQYYGDKPAAELPMLFQRILSNTTLDWFRRRKTRNALFSNLSEFSVSGEDGDFDLLETLESLTNSEGTESAQDATERAQILRAIEVQIQALPDRQREAFLMRYWEEMDVAETAAAMGCSEGSVKTHCSRAVHALSKALSAKGIKL
ncbi:RNA polymerase sigma-70 factor (ECF subfamily) [Polaromonas sp. CG_9.2]|jgi:RNA polymerase sigma-70 factor (ECF subfamily)|nr:RNA polymerase sigma-70 factor (ECF subfamily) [Polaromonas sp. CG_9.2]